MVAVSQWLALDHASRSMPVPITCVKRRGRLESRSRMNFIIAPDINKNSLLGKRRTCFDFRPPALRMDSCVGAVSWHVSMNTTDRQSFGRSHNSRQGGEDMSVVTDSGGRVTAPCAFRRGPQSTGADSRPVSSNFCFQRSGLKISSCWTISAATRAMPLAR